MHSAVHSRHGTMHRLKFKIYDLLCKIYIYIHCSVIYNLPQPEKKCRFGHDIFPCHMFAVLSSCAQKWITTHYDILAPVPSKARTGCYWVSSLLYGTRLPLWQWGATKDMEWNVFYQFCSLLSQRQSHTQTRSRSAVQSILSLAPRCPRGSLVPYESDEHKFCGALLTERTVWELKIFPFLRGMQYCRWHPRKALNVEVTYILTNFILGEGILKKIRLLLDIFQKWPWPPPPTMGHMLPWPYGKKKTRHFTRQEYVWKVDYWFREKVGENHYIRLLITRQ